MISFTAHWPLWLLASLPLVWWVGSRSRTKLSSRHIFTAGALRAAVLFVLMLALMRPFWQAGTSDVSVVYALDVSRSVASGFVQSALDFVAEANAEARPMHARYVVFADRPRLVNSPADIPKLAVVERATDAAPEVINQGATNLERALDEALHGFEPNEVKRLVLFSDGNQTAGDVWRVLPRLQAAGARLFAFPATPRAPDDAWVESIQAPQPLRRDEAATVVVRVTSQRGTRARVRIASGSTQLAARSLRLLPGSNTVPLQVRLREQGAVALSVEVQADGDTLSDNDRLQQSVWVAARARVLYVEGQSGTDGYLRDALIRDGLDVTVGTGGDLPESVDRLAPYDAVIVSDVPVADLTVPRMEALAAYVRDLGGGLIFAAGETTYGQSGLSSSVLEEVLPVEFKAQEKRKDLALVICLDRSYSMKGRPLDLAKAATRAALALLEEQHRFAVVAFDSQPHEAVPLQYVRSRRKAEDLIDRIQASGQTNIYPALAAAWRMLHSLGAKKKHIIVLSDGDTAPADFDRLLKRITDAQISVSTVTLGRAGDPELMAKIASLGNGKAYVAEDVAQLPEILIEDTQNVSRATLIEDPFRPVVKRRIEALRGIDFAHGPPLRGLASTKPKEDGEVFLATESGAPVLARWQYGLGRAVMFASDVKNRWAADWLSWEGYGRFWSQLVRDTMRRDTGEDVAFDVLREGNEAHVSLALMTAQGKWRNRLAPSVRVTLPNGSRTALALRQTAPGQYDDRMPVTTSAATPFTFQLEDAGGVSRDLAQRAGIRRLYYPFADEYRSLPPDVELLRALAEKTGGKLAPSTAEIFADQGDRGSTRFALWPWLAALALALYLCDIAVRRVPRFKRWMES